VLDILPIDSWLPLDLIGFLALAAATIAASVMVLIIRDLVKSALMLAVALFCVAAIFIALGAEMMAAIQLLVYVGAVVVLIIFGIMLTRRDGVPR